MANEFQISSLTELFDSFGDSEDLSRYSNKLETVGLRICPYFPNEKLLQLSLEDYKAYPYAKFAFDSTT